ncbi:hypothetical protein B0A54_02306 [Friedmanniomyces endolithicus]|uniref:Uncharacterized protein n=1 Tax=Friedmanniomyces endolithicus TaxID=329885 RepID=A0A4U0VC21_9PEZI|nr:hypothetical protein B0A54_02306 [Friedmanniomyces endolithicus]
MDPSSTTLPFGLLAPTPTLATTSTILNYLVFYTSTFVLAIASAVGAVELIARLRSNTLGAAELQSDHYARLGVGACAAILYPAAWITRAVGCLGGIVGVAGLVVAAVAVRVWAREAEDDEEGVGVASGEGVGVEGGDLEMMECGGVRAEALSERGQVEAVRMELR